MKYVILQNPESPFPEFRMTMGNTTHKDLVADLLKKRFTVIGAAYLRFLADGRFETFSYSTSLNVGPHKDDARLLAAFYRGTLKTATAAPAAELAHA